SAGSCGRVPRARRSANFSTRPIRENDVAVDAITATQASPLQYMPTASRDIVVSNKLGLHARPAMQFVDLANQFKADIVVKKGGAEPAEADGKSVMQMIILAATEGTPLTIQAT